MEKEKRKTQTYSKIDTLYQRYKNLGKVELPNKAWLAFQNKIIIGHFSEEVIAYLKNNLFDCFSKIDGTNTKIIFYPSTGKISYGGKTDDAQLDMHDKIMPGICEKIKPLLVEMFPPECARFVPRQNDKRQNVYYELDTINETEPSEGYCAVELVEAPVYIYGELFGAKIQKGGGNYSYMMTNDMNGDGYNYDSVFIPTDEQVANGEFRFVSADDQNRFMDYVHKDSYLSKHQGQYAEAYSVYSPWVHRLDFSYKHDFTVKIGQTKNTLQLSFDIKNLLNLFNSSWGVAKYMNPSITDARILKYEGVDAQGYATYSTPSSISGSTQTWTSYHALSQCWYASIGLKYLFN